MDTQIVLLLIPLAVIELALAIVAVVDAARRKVLRFLPRWGWIAVIVFVGIVGPVVYLILGRGEEHAESDGSDSH